MLFLFISIISSVFIAHIFKYADKQTIPIYGIMAVNYSIATGISVMESPGNPFAQPIGSLLIAVVLGVLFFATFVLLMMNVQRSGLSIPVSLMRLSAVMPTIGSIVFFKEIPDLYLSLGILIAFIAIPFSAPKRPSRSNLDQFLHSGFLLGLLLFISFGVNDFGLKIQTEVHPEIPDSSFLVIVFLTAFILSVAAIIYNRIKLCEKMLIAGAGLGIVNYASTFFFLAALEYVPGTIIYPLNGISIILLTAVSSFFIWHEKPAKHNYIFFTLAIMALLLIY